MYTCPTLFIHFEIACPKKKQNKTKNIHSFHTISAFFRVPSPRNEKSYEVAVGQSRSETIQLLLSEETENQPTSHFSHVSNQSKSLRE